MGDFVKEDLWGAAYQKLGNDETSLIKNYERLLEAAIPDHVYASLQERIQAILTLKREQILQRQWKLQWGNKSIRIRTQVERVLRLVNVFKDVGTIATNADPIHAGLPWAGLCLLLTPVLSDSDQSEALMKGLDVIADIIARYRIVVDRWWIDTDARVRDACSVTNAVKPQILLSGETYALPDSGVSKRPTGSAVFNESFRTLIIKLYKSVLEYQAKAACYLSRNTLARMARNLPKLDNWTHLLENICRLDVECREHKTVFDSAIIQSSLVSLSERFRSQEKILKMLASSRYRMERTAYEILLLISDVMVRQDHDDVRTRLGHQYWQSGRWLLGHKNYAAWRESRSAVLWLRGPVGVGKTCLTSVVVQESLANAINERVAFFYCSQQQGEPGDIFRSFIAQLSLSSDGSLAKPTRKWFEYHTGFSTNSGREFPPDSKLSMKQKITLTESVDLLAEITNSADQTTLILDALDECSDPYAFLGCLESLLGKCAKIRVFISARLSVLQTPEFSHSLSISHFVSSSDMETFINCEINSQDRRARSGMTPEQAQQLRRILVSRAEGMFRWVGLQLDILLNKRFPLRHPKDVQTKIDSLRLDLGHKSLNLVYDEIFVLNTQDQGHVRSLVVKALRWILCSFKPLTMDALVQAVALDSAGHVDPFVDQDFVLQICSNFITVTASGCVKFAHRSVKEYLMRSELPGCNRREEMSTLSAHIQAAETCLTFLLSLCDDSKWGHLPIDAHKDAKNVHFSSFEMYACFYWASHSEMAIGFRIEGALRKFLLIDHHINVDSSNLPLDNRKTFARISYQKWISLLWRVLHTDQSFEGLTRQRLEDAVSDPPNPIFASCIWGFQDVVSNLAALDSRVIHAYNHRGKSPLFLACENGNSSIVRALVEHQVAVGFEHPIWGSALQAAAWAGDFKSFRLLLQRGAPINSPEGVYGRLIDAAVIGGDERVVTYALSNGADVWLPRAPRRVPAMGKRPPAFPPSRRKAMGASIDQALANHSWKAKSRDVAVRRVTPDVDLVKRLFPSGYEPFIDRIQKANLRRHQLFGKLELCNKEWPGFFVDTIEEDITEKGSKLARSTGLPDDHDHYSNFKSLTMPQAYDNLPSTSRVAQCSPCFLPPQKSRHVEDSLSCPYCYLHLNATTSFDHKWIAHVVRDLRPYLCPFVNCDSNEKLYGSRGEWGEHVYNHRKAKKRKAKIRQQLEMSRMEEDDQKDQNWRDTCPLCRTDFAFMAIEGGETYEDHLAYHMEVIALQAGSIQVHDHGSTEDANRGTSSGSSEEDGESINAWSSDSSHFVNSQAESGDDKEED